MVEKLNCQKCYSSTNPHLFYLNIARDTKVMGKGQQELFQQLVIETKFNNSEIVLTWWNKIKIKMEEIMMIMISEVFNFVLGIFQHKKLKIQAIISKYWPIMKNKI